MSNLHTILERLKKNLERQQAVADQTRKEITDLEALLNKDQNTLPLDNARKK